MLSNLPDHALAGRLQACDHEAYFPSREMLSICRTMPSPGGQISEMAGYEYCCG
jgi:hypothetical protein